jgi:hypothetical protein
MGVRTRGLDIKAGAAKIEMERAARLEAGLVIDRCNRPFAAGRGTLWSPTIRAAGSSNQYRELARRNRILFDAVVVKKRKETHMAPDDGAPNQKKKPGDRPEGTFHFNPGNMAGKTIGAEANDQVNLTQNRTVSSAKRVQGNTTRPTEAAHASTNSMDDRALTLARSP